MIPRLLAALLAAMVLVACSEGDDRSGGPAAETPATVLEAASAAAGSAPASADPTGGLPLVTVYKSPTCGCCSAWVEHMREAGFEVVARDTADMAAIKAEHGVAPRHQSCHTALVDGYVIEGHVPAEDVARLLDERPDIAALVVPGMPRGSPGMEMPDGSKDSYDVIAVDSEGEEEVFSSR